MNTFNPLAVAEKIAGFVQCDKSGSCGVFATWVTRVFLRHGFKKFTVIFGIVKDKHGWHDHIWIVLDTGEKIDPTAKQFDEIEYYDEKETHLYPDKFLVRRGFRLEDPKTPPWYKQHLRNKTPLKT